MQRRRLLRLSATTAALVAAASGGGRPSIKWSMGGWPGRRWCRGGCERCTGSSLAEDALSNADVESNVTTQLTLRRRRAFLILSHQTEGNNNYSTHLLRGRRRPPSFGSAPQLGQGFFSRDSDCDCNSPSQQKPKMSEQNNSMFNAFSPNRLRSFDFISQLLPEVSSTSLAGTTEASLGLRRRRRRIPKSVRV